MEAMQVWVVRDSLTGLYIGRDGKLTKRLNRAAYFTSRNVARIAAQRFAAKFGIKFPVRNAQRAELKLRSPSLAVAA